MALGFHDVMSREVLFSQAPIPQKLGRLLQVFNGIRAEAQDVATASASPEGAYA